MVIGLCFCAYLAWLREAGVFRLPPYATLHTVKFTQEELPGACELEMLMTENSTAHLLGTADWRKRVPICCQEMGQYSGDIRSERGGKSDSVQTDRKIDCILSTAASKTCSALSLDGRLLFHFSYVLRNSRLTWLIWTVTAACKSWIQCMQSWGISYKSWHFS